MVDTALVRVSTPVAGASVADVSVSVLDADASEEVDVTLRVVNSGRLIQLVWERNRLGRRLPGSGAEDVPASVPVRPAHNKRKLFGSRQA